MPSYCYTDPPLAYADNLLMVTRRSNPQGPDGIEMGAIIARVWSQFTEPYCLPDKSLTIPKLNLDESDVEFRQYLDNQGIELDELLVAAGAHFTSQVPSPTETLTVEQRKIFAEDTLRGASN